MLPLLFLSKMSDSIVIPGIIQWIKRHHKGKVIADMGCGEGRLGQEIRQMNNSSKSQETVVHSFDLVSHSPHVIAADIAHVPLEPASVDIVVFCLSLMGTNIGNSYFAVMPDHNTLIL